MNRLNFPFIWALFGIGIVAVECYTLGMNQSAATLSATMRMIRFDPIGRFVLLPLWCWLTLHWLIAPKWLGVRPDWRSLVAIGVGLVWAVLETARHR